MFGGSIVADAASARSGNRRYNAKILSATMNAGVVIPLASLTLNASELFDYRYRLYFRPMVFPSANNLIIGNISATSTLELQMNTAGALRMGTSGGFTATSYQGSTSIGRWYRADFRIHGVRTAGTINEFRVRGTIDVYDVGTDGLNSPSLIVSFANVDNNNIFADLNTTKVGFCATEPHDTARLNPPGGFEFDLIAAMVGSYDVDLLDSVAVPLANGTGWTIFSAGEMRKFIGCTTQEGAGEDVHFKEIGTLQGLPLVKFFNTSTAAVPTSVEVGQVGDGPSCTREIDYDDVIWDLGTGSDAALVRIPSFVRVYLFAVTGQGAFDQFSPAGAFANVAEIPRDNVASVSESVLDEATTYTHAPLADSNDVVYHVRCYMNATSNGNQHKILIGSDEFSFNFNAFTGDSDASTNRADKSSQEAPLNAAAFAALQFGGKVGTGGSTLTIKNILLEILGGPAGDVLPEAVFDPDDLSPVGLTWVEFTDSNNGFHVWSTIALPDPASYFGGYKEHRVIEWGVIRRALSNIDGTYEGSAWSWINDDSDRSIRALLAGQLTKWFFNRSITARSITDPLRRLLKLPRTVFRGVVRGFQPLPGGRFSFDAEDYLVTTFQIGTDEQQVPKRTINRDPADTTANPDFGHGILEDVFDLPVPIIYGSYSDENLVTTIVPGVPGTPGKGMSPPVISGGIVGSTGSRYVGYCVTWLSEDSNGEGWEFRDDQRGETTRSNIVEFSNAPNTLDKDNYVFITWPAHPGFEGKAKPPWSRVYKRESPNGQFRPIDGGDPPSSWGGHPGLWFYHDGERRGFTENDRYDSDNAPPLTNNTIVGGDPGIPESSVTTDSGRGLIPVIPVGDLTIQQGFHNGVSLRQFLVCGHAVKAITSWYVNGIRRPISSADVGGSWVVPGYPSWDNAFGAGAAKYKDFNGRRYTVIYVFGTDGDVGAGIQPPDNYEVSEVSGITVNIEGIEDLGDGSGTLITSLLDQYLHALQNWLIGNYQSGAWLASPVFPDDITLKQIDEDSFAQAKATSETRVAGGYVGRTHFGVDRLKVSVREAIARLNMSCDVNSGFNLKTQFFVSMQSEAVSQLAATSITQARDILKDSFSVRALVEEFFNRVPYQYGYLPKTQAFQFTLEASDQVSITASKETRSARVRTLYFVFDAAVALDIASRFLTRSKEVPRLVSWDMGLAGLNFELGDILVLSHADGVGSNGYVDAPIRVSRQDYDPGRFIVSLEGYDVGQFFSDAFILGDETALPASWTSATTAQRVYGYLCNEVTQLFSDGARGKRLR